MVLTVPLQDHVFDFLLVIVGILLEYFMICVSSVTFLLQIITYWLSSALRCLLCRTLCMFLVTYVVGSDNAVDNWPISYKNTKSFCVADTHTHKHVCTLVILHNRCAQVHTTHNTYMAYLCRFWITIVMNVGEQTLVGTATPRPTNQYFMALVIKNIQYKK